MALFTRKEHPMARTYRFLVSVGILAVGAIGVAVAQERESKPVDTGLIQVDRAPGVRTPQPGPRGRYKTLLQTIEVPADRAQYGDFYDYGYWSGTSYAGHDGLRPGYWVYLAPNWHIYRDAADESAAGQSPRGWGPEQATGAPNTWPNAGDLGTAWASQTPDGQREWLELTYDAPIRPAAVLIYETYNPGAVDRITGYDAAGKEIELWSGADPTPAGSEKGISVIPLHPAFDLKRIRVYLDSPRVAGWNEIDAVGLLDAAGTTHWAASATASSSYADQILELRDLRADRLEQDRRR